MAALNITVGDGSSYESVVAATSGLVSRYKMGETSGTTITDDISGYNGTISGSYTLNQRGLLGAGNGKSIRFTDTGSVAVSSTNALSGKTTFSVELLVQPETIDYSASTGWNQRLVRCESGTGASARGFSLFLQRNGTGSVEQGGVYLVASYYDGNGTITYHVPARRHNTDQLAHVVVTYDGATSTSTIYVNGRSHSLTRTLAAIPTAALLLGGAPSVGLRGLMSEVAFYNRVLSASEVMSHYGAVGELAGAGITGFNRIGARTRTRNEYAGPANDETQNFCTNPAPTSTTGFQTSGAAIQPTIAYSNGAVTMTTPSNTDTVLNGGQGSKMRLPGSIPVGAGWVTVEMTVTANITADLYLDITDNSQEGASGTNAGGAGYRNQYLAAGVPTRVTWSVLTRTGLTKTSYVGSFTPNATLTINNLNFHYGNSVLSYFDGNSTGGRWLGTANGSVSALSLTTEQLTAARNTNETTTSATSVQSRLDLLRALSEQTQTYETALSLRGLITALSDALAEYDSAQSLQSLTRLSVNTSAILDEARRAVNLMRHPSDFHLSQIVAAVVRSLNQGCVEAAPSSSEALAQVHALRNAGQQLLFAETVLRTVGLLRPYPEHAFALDAALLALIPGIVGSTNALVVPHRGTALMIEHIAEALIEPYATNASVTSHLAEVTLSQS